MAFFGLRSPLFLYDYAAHLGHKVLKRLRHRSKGRETQANVAGNQPGYESRVLPELSS
jgi:hypothetical protein